jgi:hypothetical protein
MINEYQNTKDSLVPPSGGGGGMRGIEILVFKTNLANTRHIKK